MSVKFGDTLTIGGIYLDKPNPAWRWWAFWRPRRIASSNLQTFRVTGWTTSRIAIDG